MLARLVFGEATEIQPSTDGGNDFYFEVESVDLTSERAVGEAWRFCVAMRALTEEVGGEVGFEWMWLNGMFAMASGPHTHCNPHLLFECAWPPGLPLVKPWEDQ
jgi:hypothetical protein